jgi:hypothetical protein
MAGIEGINGIDPDSILSFLQEVSKRNDNTAQSKETQNDGLGITNSLAANDEGIDSMKAKIDEAVEDAIKKLDKSSSLTEIMDAIKAAVDDTLKANGVDPESMKNQMPPEGGQSDKPPMPPMGGPDDEFRNKIDQLLEENGFDVETLKAQIQSSATVTSQTQSSILDFLKQLQNQEGVDTEA